MIPRVIVYRTADRPPWLGWNRYFVGTPHQRTVGAVLRVASRHLLSIQWRRLSRIRCTSCGQRVTAPPCQRSPLTGKGGHTHGGGVAAR